MLDFFKKLGVSFKESRGVSAILVILFLPVVFAGIHYLIQYTQKSDVHTTNTGIPYVLGKAIARAFNPGKTFGDQKEYLYSVAAQVYNDGAYISGKEMALEHEKTIKVGVKSQTQSISSLCDFYANYCINGRSLNSAEFSTNDEMLVNYPPFANFVYNESKQKISFSKSKKGVVQNEEAVDTINKYKEDKSKLELSLNSKRNIEASCHGLGQKAEIIMPRNDVDIIIAIPTNRASNTTTNNNDAAFADYSSTGNAAVTPIRQIVGACQLFLKNFLHTAGIAVGIVPYSGKVSLSPYSKDSYTTRIAMNTRGPSLPYAIQAMFYGSDGKYGGDIIVHGSTGNAADSLGDYKDWGTSEMGLPIMARRGQQRNYRNMVFYSGALADQVGRTSLLLDMTTSPTTGDNYKFMQMNTNPCYLGFCNILAMTCEKDCPTFMANPYFMTELTSDVQSLIYDLELFVPFKDERNKSNFLFLPIVMAGNLFSWGDHPSEWSSSDRVKESSRRNKKRVVIVIANAPDNFEPQEMTYLGFNNDYSEIPMIESDTILFNRDRGFQYDENSNIYMGVKGAVRFSTSDGSLDSKGYLFKDRQNPKREMRARISFPHKGLLKIVAERENPATVTVYSDNGVEDNVGTRTFLNSKTLTFRGPQQVYNWGDLSTSFRSGYYTTKGPNFGHNTSTKKVKIKFTGCKLNNATLSNQILRFYGTYSSENGKSQIGGRMDPCISFGSGASESSGWVDQGSYIKAYGFSPSCSGISSSGKFVMAAGRASGSDIIDDTSVGGKGVKHSSGTKYRVYNGGSPFYTGELRIKNNAYYDTYVNQKVRSRKVTQTITTKRTFPDMSTTATQGTETDQTSSYNNSYCCSKRWAGYYIPDGTKPRNCDPVSISNYWPNWPKGLTRLDTENCSCGSGECSPVEYVGDNDCTIQIRQTCSEYDIPGGGKYKFCYLNKAEYSCSTQIYSSNRQDHQCCRAYTPCYCPLEKKCVKTKVVYDYEYEYADKDKTEKCSCETSIRGCVSNKKDGECEVKCGSASGSVGTTFTEPMTCKDVYSCPSGYKEYEDTCRKVKKKTERTECTKTIESLVYDKTGYACTKPVFQTKTYRDYERSCETPVYHYHYNVMGYNDDPGCKGVCYDSVVTNASGWKNEGTSQSRSCNGSIPSTTFTESFSRDQTQYTSSCSYVKGSSSGTDLNSQCSYSSMSLPSVGYSYLNCGNSTSGSSSGSPTTDGWKNESVTEYKRFYSRYLRDIDGYDAGTECFICNTYGSSCQLTSCPANKPSSYSGTYDSSQTTRTPYRYLLYNFFFVNGSTKSTNYSYSGYYPDYTLTSTISSESNANGNGGIYLLPTGNQNEYWVCFCGDADLTLNFTEATEAAVTFSNIDPKIQYQVNFGDSAKTTAGVLRNDMDTQQIFYIHPDQIKDTLDDDGNYYVDLKLNGQPRILSVELTNRPLKMEPVNGEDSNGEIVGKDESGGKAVGNTKETVTLKFPEEAAYSFTAQPISFWVEGQSDFRQDSGQVRLCSNTKANIYFDIAVPDNGEGKITLTAEQPTRENKRSNTGQLIEEVTPNYTYTISTDRKLKSITVPSFVAPKTFFSIGSMGTESYTFCAKEVNDDSVSKLFDWPLIAFSHSAFSYSDMAIIKNGFSYNVFHGTPNTVKFNLTACRITQATAENLIMQFGPTVNDFPRLTFSNKGETIHVRSGECQDDLNFVDDDRYSTVCGYLDENGVDCRKGYWLPWSSCADRGYYSSHMSPLPSIPIWDDEITIDVTEAYNQYGPGTIFLYGYRDTKPLNVTFLAGASNVDYEQGVNTNADAVLSGLCTSSEFASAGMKERYRNPNYTGYNYLGTCYYRVTKPCDLTRSYHLSYSNQDMANHNYRGELAFHGIGDIRVYVQPQKVKRDDDYTRNMSETEVSGSFGNYKYTFSEQDYLLNLDDRDLTKSGGAFELLYDKGKITNIYGSSVTVGLGKSGDFQVSSDELKFDTKYNCYSVLYGVENASVTIRSDAYSQVGDDILSIPGQKNPEEKIFTISPSTHTFQKKVENGKTYYYVTLKNCKNVYISNLRAAANLLVYYAHPDIINENLINTRIIDGYDRAIYRQMTLYGNMNYNNGSLPSVSAVQRLFYNVKTNNASRYFYPRISGVGSALEEEEGDFFIQIWDYARQAPAVLWKIGDAIQLSTGDIVVSNSGFGAFKSNYAFNGLHRMFFPYSIYNRDYAGYSYASNSALVFAGYTLPINLILASNGYQTTYSLDSGNVSGYTRPKEALANLANDACERLKTDLANEQGKPVVLLVKYRTDSTLSLEDCADETYSASSEGELNAKLNEIAQIIRQNGQPLRVDVSDI